VGRVAELTSLGAVSRMNFSSLKQGQVAVIQAERTAGIVLTSEGTRHMGSGEAFQPFESLEAARAFAKGVVDAKPEVECGLYDCTGAHLERIVSAR
jgi:hypothetical protein